MTVLATRCLVTPTSVVSWCFLIGLMLAFLLSLAHCSVLPDFWLMSGFAEAAFNCSSSAWISGLSVCFMYSEYHSESVVMVAGGASIIAASCQISKVYHGPETAKETKIQNQTTLLPIWYYWARGPQQEGSDQPILMNTVVILSFQCTCIHHILVIGITTKHGNLSIQTAMHSTVSLGAGQDSWHGNFSIPTTQIYPNYHSVNYHPETAERGGQGVQLHTLKTLWVCKTPILHTLP